MTEQKLPKWFTGQLYTKGFNVTNPFSGESIDLKPAELSMYDYIMSCVILNQYGAGFNKAMLWFKKENPEAYMVLLD